MKDFYARIIILFILVSASFGAFAQRSSGLMIDGTVTVEEGNPDNVIIEMYEDGKKAPDYGIGSSGKFKVELNYNHKFELVFKREGNFSQKIVVETAVPKTVLDSNPRFPAFPVNINLFKEIPGVDASFSENTILKIFYSPSVDNFVQELYYNDAQIKKLIEQAMLQGEQIDKRAEYMSKLTRAELAELRKEYNELLEQAGKEYADEQFLDALDGYKAASQIFPDEQFPKDRIAEINDLLGLIMVAEELDKAKLERFDKLVKDGDLQFTQQKYPDAKKSYDRALSIKPNDQYVNGQLDKIAQIQKQRHLEEEYNTYVASGDKALKELLYNEAIGQFQKALELKPNEVYPKNKINEINGLLASQREDQQKQQNYEEAMTEGEREFSKQFYDRALTAFENALTYRPNDPTANKRIAETKEIMQGILDQMAFDKFIAEADKAYKKEQFSEALSNYEEALALVPDEPRTKKRVEEIRQILYTRESIDSYISQADKQFDQQKYAEAKTLYERARELDSKNKYVSDRLSEIAQLLAGQEQDARYAEVLASADALLNSQDYGNAKNKYNEALSIKAKENYPKEKISQIDDILSSIAKTNSDYQAAIAKADRLFEQKNYPEARNAFTDAGKIKPDETYPGEKIAEIDGLLAEQQRLAEAAAEAEAARLAAIQAEKDKNYSDAIARADNLFDEQSYENSRNEYRSALVIKPEETYPQQRIDEIGTILAQLSAAQKAYEEAIARGDREFNREGWDAAIAAYNEAKQAKSDETYPDDQLAKIDSIVSTRERLAREAAEAEAARLAAIQVEKDKNYSDAIARADNLFDEQNYENSRNEYRSALEIKPDETYPQQRIDEIGTILAQLSAAQKAYEEAIARGDREFNREGWDAAIAAYNEAKQAKSDETYPNDQLAKIDSIVSTRERLAKEAAEAETARLAAIQAEKDKNYSDAIARADNLFDEQSYENSRNEYRSALVIKPDETYPQQRIDEIGTILAQLSAAQKAYEEAIAKGDREFNREGWDAAIAAYNEAKQAKSDETYPNDQLAKIDSIVSTRERLAKEAAEAETARLAAIQAEKDKNYSDAIARADNLFDEQSYENSRNEYRSALVIKPDETYPQQRIDEIGTILAQLSAAQKAYEEAIAKGDREFNREGWDAAIAAYNEAKQAKSDETYPNDQLAKIDSIVSTRERLAKEAAEAETARLAAIQAEKDKNYSDAIARADNLFDEKNYENSRNEYRSALEIKPEETYPQQRITEIDGILKQIADAKAAQEALDRQYANLIQQADRLFSAKSYTPSKENYQQASGLKPDENYPKEKIAEINGILEQQALDEKYRNVIVAADGFFRTQKYDDARLQYEIALGVKPEEEYPKSQIRRIDELKAQEEARKNAEVATAADVERRRANIAKMQEELDEQKILEESGINALYDQLILKADAFFDDTQYNVSRAWYFKALDLKPEESYPQQRIDEINRLLNGMMLSQRDREYQRFIDLADNSFRENELAVARGWYNQAIGQKADEQYPKDQLAEIERLVQERLQGRSADRVAQYNETAKKAFDSGDMNVARFWYKKALELNPDNAEAKAGLEQTRD